MPSEILNHFISFNRNTLIGELKLQSCEEANIFYAAHIHTDENLGWADYSKHAGWQASAFTHQMRMEEDVVMVDGDSTIIQGVYKDRLGEQNTTELEYVISVCVWVETESEEKKGAAQ